MRFTLREKTKTWRMIIGLLVLFVVEWFYFTYAIPLSNISNPLLFWVSYSVWAFVGLFTLIIDIPNKRRKSSLGGLAFVVLLLITAVASIFSRTLWALAQSLFPGFFGGTAFYGLLVLGYRVRLRSKHRSRVVSKE